MRLGRDSNNTSTQYVVAIKASRQNQIAKTLKVALEA